MTARPNLSAGFTLIELLIGVALSLIGLAAVGQIMLTFNQQRATITHTQSTQNNGVMALYRLEKDIAQAGYGMMNLQNCDRIHFVSGGVGFHESPYGTSDLPGSSNVALTTLPVRIIDGGVDAGGDPVSDTIEVQYGSSASGAPALPITAAQAGGYSSAYTTSSSLGMVSGDLFVANVDNLCTLGAVTNTNPVATPIEHDVADPYNVASAPGGSGWNAVNAGSLTAANPPFLANLGAFVSRRYTVAAAGATSALNVAELPAFAANNLVDDIVFVKAQYGLAADANGQTVTSWASGATAINNVNTARVIAIRVGVVARSPIYEKNDVSAPTTLTVLPAIASGGATIGLAVTWDVPDTHHRYRAFSVIIPLKNVIWTR